jgi:hypothetical protein
MVIVNIPWLCHEVIGPILAPPVVGSVQRLTVDSNDGVVDMDAVRLVQQTAAGQGPAAVFS